MRRKLIYLMSFILVLAYFAGQANAVSEIIMGIDGYADRVIIRDDGEGNATWLADASGSGGFGDGIADANDVFGFMTDIHMLGDVSGDGIADRIVARQDTVDNYWAWFADYSTPTGFGDGVVDASQGFGGLSLIPHAVVDLDGDGIADRVGVDDTDGNHNYYGDKAPAGGGFGDSMGDWVMSFGAASMPLIGMTDLDGDGLADRVINLDQAGGNPSWISDMAPVGGGFGDGMHDWEGYFGAATMELFVGDLNADGYGDRAVAIFDGTNYNWVGDLSSSTNFGDGSADIDQIASFGIAGDILLLGDVLLEEGYIPDGFTLEADVGWDIFTTTSYNYRYGPSFIINDDGSIDMWAAAPDFGSAVWDYIVHKRSTDNGVTWGTETVALSPTSGSLDAYAVCDPGVIKFGGYYYIGYTSTTVYEGTDNDTFVARSTSPTGPYDKWNGSGWGGNPQPIIEYTDSPGAFGCGEPSFVVKDDTLYIYYTWDSGLPQTRVATADATNANWPSGMTFHGTAIQKAGGSDSSDVKYVNDSGKFIAVNTANRFTDQSYIQVWTSLDGLTFTRTGEALTNILPYCHNMGISGDELCHINTDEQDFIAYAHGDVWGHWSTHMNPVTIYDMYYCQHPVGDFNGDCIVNFLDFAIFASHWLDDTRGI